ncbi:MAG: AAA family ATPase, partial [Clostridia bacterium]|nr:AAA family ATPase [Clostridia bacterium]
MNIAEAKEQIKNSIQIYLKKNQFGDYRIPLVHQRPVFLLGSPGIGKTAIMEQIAQELNIALVVYSMTHHTRQSALGLPFIEHKTYAGQEMVISEYTMSEIIASIYETMERSGLKEGILFLKVDQKYFQKGS